MPGNRSCKLDTGCLNFTNLKTISNTNQKDFQSPNDNKMTMPRKQEQEKLKPVSWAVNCNIFTYTFFIVCVCVCIHTHSEISPTRCNNCVFIVHNGFTLHVSGDNLTHHQEYICCIWPQVSRLT